MKKEIHSPLYSTFLSIIQEFASIRRIIAIFMHHVQWQSISIVTKKKKMGRIMRCSPLFIICESQGLLVHHLFAIADYKAGSLALNLLASEVELSRMYSLRSYDVGDASNISQDSVKIHLTLSHYDRSL